LLILFLGLAISGMSQQTGDDTAKDPVCGMTMKRSEAKATFDYSGKTYYFCSAGCKDTFVKDPEKYIQKKEEAAPEETRTCPEAGKEMPAQTASHGQMMGQCPMIEHKHGQMAGSTAGMSCPLHSKDVEIKTEILPDGVAVKFTSKNPETVKKIREHLEKMKSCCAGCCQPQPDVKK
jgi:YHS domain-containing protein